ncbi:hypothetical protein P152DRAFT_475936 [Eremomyces bilateralis CBS 781.70]|uniref:[histone H3]-trimethyl-L-lysine(9) demethylase n=1 Tax=Eremomyces bilateralis CBS 781.70 TaxID=1392243 RepID=A0A6G1FWM9_9PEZI|nr:uncharacterized protein P152DRAFT_475936 [Eremomyces bilateralis CBS 781.70]KAF1810090.1 hypothetical protein P152DRAFT_475936 [Eremomyces bilateralis CBS 781.70]
MESAVVADAPPNEPIHDGGQADPPQQPKAALTPPTSEDQDHEKRDDASSILSDIDMENEEDDIGEIEPDHYYEGGKIPVFKPTMDQFRSFSKFVEKVDKYGMKSGIVKVIPPPEWRESLPSLEEKIKAIRVKNPITQEFAGTHGTYTQANIEKQRSYNLPQWKSLCEETSHQPPARRGERRRQAEVAPKPKPRRLSPLPNGEKRRPGRPRKRPLPKEPPKEEKDTEQPATEGASSPVPPTPMSPPGPKVTETDTTSAKHVKIETPTEAARVKKEPTPKPRGRQPKTKSISSRRMFNRQDAAQIIDEESFNNFDYHLANVDEFTKERCEELEEVYWKTLNYGTPMYGADMPGSLFDDTVASWNVAKLDNLLDVLGTKVPGVNTTYLYLGQWKATFAWHLEDVDLYSINYIHFGAPKQWYSISQCDARRFEAAMKSIWPQDAKNCNQFLRHKTYLISPEKLKSQFNITVNKLVHREGEFVITYPYGYHSGFNIGYNCAESVNFATESWLDFGRIAKKCDCEADSVWIDIAEIERKLRGEPTPEYYTDYEDDDMDDVPQDLPSPPASTVGKAKGKPGRKRKADVLVAKDAEARKAKRIKIKIKKPTKEPCVLCPNDVAYDVLLPTDTGQQAHRLCGLYTPETFLSEQNGVEKVFNIAGIGKDRLELRCNFCRSRRGACFQCSSKKCTRAYHATCAAAAGVQVDSGPMPTFDTDGTEYFYEGYDFRCRYHRVRRGKTITLEHLENNKLVHDYAKKLRPNDVVQAQLFGADVFGGTVLENRPAESSCLISLLPSGDSVEVEWKYLLVLAPSDSLRPKPSANAVQLPDHLSSSNAALDPSNRKDGVPTIDTPFHDPNAPQKWAEFVACDQDSAGRPLCNPAQTKVDLAKPEQLWFYLGKTSTEARAQFTHDLRIRTHNTKSNFLDLVRPARTSSVVPSIPRYSLSPHLYTNQNATSAGTTVAGKPYTYKPKVPIASLPWPVQRALQPSPSPAAQPQPQPYSQPPSVSQPHPQSRPPPPNYPQQSSHQPQIASSHPRTPSHPSHPLPGRAGVAGTPTSPFVTGAQLAGSADAQLRYYQQLQATKMVDTGGPRGGSSQPSGVQRGAMQSTRPHGGTNTATAVPKPGVQAGQTRQAQYLNHGGNAATPVVNPPRQGSGTPAVVTTLTRAKASPMAEVKIKQEPGQTESVTSIASVPTGGNSHLAPSTTMQMGSGGVTSRSPQPTVSEQISEYLTAVDKPITGLASASPQPQSKANDSATRSQPTSVSRGTPAADSHGTEPFVRSPTFSGLSFQSPSSLHQSDFPLNHATPSPPEFPSLTNPAPSEFPLNRPTPAPTDFPFTHPSRTPSESATINPAALTATPGDLIDPSLFTSSPTTAPHNYLPQQPHQQGSSPFTFGGVVGALDARRSSINLPTRPTGSRLPPLSHVRSISVGQKPVMQPPMTLGRSDAFTIGQSQRFPRPVPSSASAPGTTSAIGSSTSSGSSTPHTSSTPRSTSVAHFGAGSNPGLSGLSGTGPGTAGWDRGPASARYDNRAFNPPPYEEAERLFARSPSTGRTPVRLSPVVGTTTPGREPESKETKGKEKVDGGDGKGVMTFGPLMMGRKEKEKDGEEGYARPSYSPIRRGVDG